MNDGDQILKRLDMQVIFFLFSEDVSHKVVQLLLKLKL